MIRQVTIRERDAGGWVVTRGDQVTEHPTAVQALQAVKDGDQAAVDATGGARVSVITWEPCSAAGIAVAMSLAIPAKAPAKKKPAGRRRYCGPCDRWVVGRECPACGADTETGRQEAR